MHLRDARGLPTADLKIGREVLNSIQAVCPAIVQLSTGVGLEVPFEECERLVELRPAMATLNPCTMSFGSGAFRNPPAGVQRLASRMRELGVKPELEIYDSGHLDVCMDLLRQELLVEPLQFSIVLGVRGGMSATAENLLHMIRRLAPGAVWQAIAIGRQNLSLTTVAVALGGNARTGLEDVLYIRKGEPADNRPLVSRLVRIVEAQGSLVASVEDARKQLL